MTPQKSNVCSCHLSFFRFSIYRGVVGVGRQEGLGTSRLVKRLMCVPCLTPMAIPPSSWCRLARHQPGLIEIQACGDGIPIVDFFEKKKKKIFFKKINDRYLVIGAGTVGFVDDVDLACVFAGRN